MTRTPTRLRSAACRAYVLAAERAEAVGAPEASESAFLKAGELSTEETERAGFEERAGRMAALAAWPERATLHFETSIALYSGAGQMPDAARVTAWLGATLGNLGRQEQAISRLREALGWLAGTTAPQAVVAQLHARLGGALLFSGHLQEAAEPIEQALRLGQHFELAEPFASALLSKAQLLASEGRIEEARFNYDAALAVARRHGVEPLEMSAEGNLADLCMTCDLPGAEEHCLAGLALARRRGARFHETFAAHNLMYVLTMAGRFDEAYRLANDLLQAGGDKRHGADLLHWRLAMLDVLVGSAESARLHLARCESWAERDDVQARATYEAAECGIALGEGHSRVALEAGSRAIEESFRGGLEISHEAIRVAFPDAVDAALRLSDLDEAERLIDLLASRPPGQVPPFLRAQVARSQALVFAARGEDAAVEEKLVAAEATFRELGYPYWTARAQLDRAEWLLGQGRPDESAELAGEAEAIFDTVGAAPMLARARALLEAEDLPSLGAVESPTRG